MQVSSVSAQDHSWTSQPRDQKGKIRLAANYSNSFLLPTTSQLPPGWKHDLQQHIACKASPSPPSLLQPEPRRDKGNLFFQSDRGSLRDITKKQTRVNRGSFLYLIGEARRHCLCADPLWQIETGEWGQSELQFFIQPQSKRRESEQIVWNDPARRANIPLSSADMTVKSYWQRLFYSVLAEAFSLV